MSHCGEGIPGTNTHRGGYTDIVEAGYGEGDEPCQ